MTTLSKRRIAISEDDLLSAIVGRKRGRCPRSPTYNGARSTLVRWMCMLRMRTAQGRSGTMGVARLMRSLPPTTETTIPDGNRRELLNLQHLLPTSGINRSFCISTVGVSCSKGRFSRPNLRSSSPSSGVWANEAADRLTSHVSHTSSHAR